MDCIAPGFPVLHQLPEFAQTHVHWVGDAIWPSHPLLPPSPPALNLPQHQGLFQWVGSSYQVAKVSELQLQYQWWTGNNKYLFILPLNIQSWFSVSVSCKWEVEQAEEGKSCCISDGASSQDGAGAAASPARSTRGHGRWAELFPWSWGPVEHDSWNPAQESRDTEPWAQMSTGSSRDVTAFCSSWCIVAPPLCH